MSQPLSELARLAAKARATHPALCDGTSREWTYEEFGNLVAAADDALTAAGVTPGTAVALAADGVAHAVAFVALLGRDALVHTPHPREQQRLASQLHAFPAAILVAAAGRVAEAEALGYRRRATFEGGDAELVVMDRAGEPQHSSPGIVFATAGSTGDPKLVVHSQLTLARALELSYRLRLELAGLSVPSSTSRSSRELVATLSEPFTGPPLGLTFLSGMPPSTIAYTTVLLQGLLLGETVALPGPFDAARTLKTIEDSRVTNVGLAPFMAQQLLREAANRSVSHSLLLIGLGGSAAPTALARRLEERFGCAVVVGYGSTELGGVAMIGRISDEANRRWSTIGHPVPGVDAQPTAGADDGVMWVRTPSLALGYLDDRLSVVPLTTADGWYRTGDIAEQTSDGDYRILGRADQMIVRGARKIDPAVVERVLESHPVVVRAAVCGMPSRISGDQDLVAAIVTVPGVAFRERDLLRHVEAALGRGYVPRRAVAVPEIPMTADGAPKRHALRDLVGATVRR